jgi:P27 family predicted phage terminase small subunit
MRGRKPLPTAVKKLRGNPGNRPINSGEPKPNSLTKVPPKHLSADAKQSWKETFKLLENTGVLSEQDTDLLCLYSETKSKWVHAMKQIKKNGYVVSAPSGFPVQSPWVQIANKSFDQLMKILPEFGFSPSARSRIKVEKVPIDDPYLLLKQRRAKSLEDWKKKNLK